MVRGAGVLFFVPEGVVKGLTTEAVVASYNSIV